MTTIDVVRTTQPLVTPNALQGLAGIAVYRGKIKSDQIAVAGKAGNAPIPVLLPSGACSWRFVNPSTVNRESDAMTLELSAPFINPFSHGASGLLARMSLGGEGATWYWVPIIARGTQFGVGAPTLLPMRD
jgi:hypothetical protein